MAAPKKPRKPRGAAQKNQYSAELTSGQLVMGITILMVFGLACFLLGVLIGKVDPSIRPNTNMAAQQPAPNPESNARDDRRNDDNEPKQSVPKDPTPEKVVSPEPEPKEVKTAPSVPKSAPIESSDLPPAKPVKQATPKPAPEPPTPTPTVEEKTIKVTKPSTKPATAQKNEPPKSTSKNKPGWYVQIGAFGTIASAEKERARVKSTYPYPIIIMKPAGSTLNKLFIGNYETKAEAEKIRQQLLKTHPGLFLHHEGKA